MALTEWLHALLGMVYPDVCELCGTALTRGEKVLCLSCLADMPYAEMHRHPDSDMTLRLVDRHAPVERTAAMFKYFKGNPYAQLVHLAKYRGRPDVARELAQIFAQAIAAEGFFADIDMVMPVPLHRFKQMKRGYNQSRAIAEGIEKATGIPVADNLKCHSRHQSQTRLGMSARWLNTRDIFSVVSAHELAGKHILVVDDVITTGSTLTSCCRALHEACPGVRTSVLTLGIDMLS